MIFIDTFRKKNGYKLPRFIGRIISFVNKIFPLNVIVEFLPGIIVKLDLKDEIQRWLFWFGMEFEYPSPQIISSWCNKASIFFDIGSNFGFYSYYVLSSHPTQKVYSFEPHPVMYKQQLETKKRNNLSSFQPNNIGIGDLKGTLKLNISSHDSSYSTFGPHSELKDKHEVQAEIISFDEWLQNNGLQFPDRPEWIAKIDVEGFEPKVIRGMHKALQAQAFYGLCVEINDYTLGFCGEKKADLFDLLTQYGYRPFDEQMQPASPLPHYELRNVFFLHPSINPQGVISARRNG